MKAATEHPAIQHPATQHHVQYPQRAPPHTGCRRGVSWLKVGLLAVALWLAAGPAGAHGAAAEADALPLHWKVVPVAEGLYMLIGEGGFTGGNLGLSVGDDGVVLIDDAMPSTLDIMNRAVHGVTDRPIDFLINTHIHGDHTGNNAHFGQQHSHIIAHSNVRRRFLSEGVSTPQGTRTVPKAALPVITFDQAVDLHLNGQDMHVFHLPHAHTDGDAAIYFSPANVLHTGDVLFNRIFPFIDYSKGGSLDGYIHAQKTLLKAVDDQTRIIPGHGVLANKKDLAASIHMLETARDRIAALIKQGKTLDEIKAAKPLAEFKDWSWSFIDSDKMVQQVYTGLKTATTGHNSP